MCTQPRRMIRGQMTQKPERVLQHLPTEFNKMYLCVGFSWLLGLCLGIPAALMARYNPGSPRNPVRPGCYIPVDPFEDVYSYSINDPGFLFNICYIVVVYLVMALFMIALIISICVRRTRNNKHRRYVKILICLAVIFFVSRAPMDMKHLTGTFNYP